LARIRVLQFVTNFCTGGTERHVTNLVAGLAASEFEVHVACFQREGPFLGELLEGAASVNDFPIRRLLSPGTLRQQLRLARYVRERGIELVHSYGFYPNVFAVPAARWAGVRAVASIRDTGDHLAPWRRRFQEWVCRRAHHVLANAEAVRSRLIEEGHDRRGISVIHNGIALERFRPVPASARVREGLGLPAEAPIVAVLARLSEVKGLEYFLEAAALLAPVFPGARFLIVGESASEDAAGRPYRVGLEEQTARLGLSGRVVFAGFRDDIPELLSLVTVSVLPSLSEGLSNTVLESMAAGVPVVATAVGGNPEMVQEGITGLLVPPRDARSLAGAIERILRDPTLGHRLGTAGRQSVTESFSLESMAQKTASLYRSLLAGARRESCEARGVSLQRDGVD